MNAFVPLLSQTSGADGMALVVPGDYSFVLLRWLVIYMAVLFAWAITSTKTTSAARKAIGRSVLVRWSAVAAGLLLVVVIPALAPRLLLPGAVLLAVAPLVHLAILGSRLGTRAAIATAKNSVRAGFLSYHIAIRIVVAAMELLWTGLKALITFDWKKLEAVPTMARQAMERLRPSNQPSANREISLLQDSGAPVDPETDPRFKGVPKSVAARFITLLQEAADLRASEIVLAKTGHNSVDIRLRIDGEVVNGPSVSPEEAELVIRLAKMLAGINVGKATQSQDGTIPIMCDGRRADVLVTAVPSNNVETLSLRITADERALIDTGLGGLGVDDKAAEVLRRLLAGHEGLVLIVGPPDAGRTTMIYTALTEAIAAGRSAALVEPVPRHHLAGVPQTRLEPGGRAAAAIEKALRHESDVLAVDDILDREAAEACMRAAITGRLVIASMRAADAADAVQRLRALGVERGPMQLAMAGVVTLRLVRVLCESCKTSYQPAPDLLGKLGIRSADPLTFHRETGCPKCRGTGFQGRTGIHELLVMDDSAKTVIAGEDFGVTAGRAGLRKSLFRSLLQSAVAKVRRGTTSVQEISRVLK